LEDSVLPDRKAQARDNIAAFLEASPETKLIVRINGTDSPEFVHDLMLCEANPGIVGILLPKTETSADVEKAAGTGKSVWPLIETAKGLLNLSHISCAEGVDRLTFGAVDLAANLRLRPGSQGARKVLDEVRVKLVLHSSAAGLAPPVESVTTDIRDMAQTRANALMAYSMGMRGMLCIHPNQVPVANEVFEPSQDEIAWAKRVLGHPYKEGAFELDGQMIDAPVIARANAILEQTPR
jgi:(S)-citramalyl-CoA lyase